MLENLETAGYKALTPVQMQVIPAALYQKDLLVCAATGSGKSMTHVTMYALPPSLAPTRELAMQIEEQAKQLMRGMDVVGVVWVWL